jgi:hypothetical protein
MHRHPQSANAPDAPARLTDDRVRQARRRVKLARKANRNPRKGRSVKGWKS